MASDRVYTLYHRLVFTQGVANSLAKSSHHDHYHAKHAIMANKWVGII
jgi:hypothetical protein